MYRYLYSFLYKLGLKFPAALSNISEKVEHELIQLSSFRSNNFLLLQFSTILLIGDLLSTIGQTQGLTHASHVLCVFSPRSLSKEKTFLSLEEAGGQLSFTACPLQKLELSSSQSSPV